MERGSTRSQEGVEHLRTQARTVRMLPKEELLNKFGGSTAVLKKTIDAFLKTWPDELAAYQQALRGRDSSAVAKKAHRIKGFVGYFASEKTYQLVVSIEQAAKASNLEEVDRLTPPFEEELSSLANNLANLSTSLP